MVTYCTVCMNNTKSKGEISYFSYPQDLMRRRAWLQAVGRYDLLAKLIDDNIRHRVRICEEHFKPSFIKYTKKKTKKYLHCDAFPTLNLPKTHEAITKEENEAALKNQGNGSSTQEDYSIPDILFMNTNCAISKTVIIEDQSSCTEQEDDEDADDDDLIMDDEPSPIILDVSENFDRKSESSILEPTEARKVKTNNLESIGKEDFLKLCDKFVPKGMSEIIKWQIDLKAGHREERQTQAFNFFALNLHYSGPGAYRFLKNTFCLPPLSTIKKFVRPVDTKIDRRLLSALKLKVDKMGTQEKICSVCVGCMPVKPNLFYDISNDRIIGFHDINGNQKPDPAKYFLVVMIRGLVHNWKQPIAHAFLSQRKNDPEVEDWIDIVITTLLDIGLDIRALVSDLDIGFVSTSKSISNDKTYFEINGHKIYYIFDTLPLIKRLKANLEKRDFVFDYDDANCFGDSYNTENRKFTVIPIDPEGDQKMHVNVQDLSNAIETKSINKVHLNIIDSVEFLSKINNLYDLLNSSTVQSPDKFKRAFRSRKIQTDFLQEMLKSFNRLKFLKHDIETDLTDTDHCIKGIEVSIKSLLQLYVDLKARGIKYIHTKRLNGDVLENFFRKVRQAGGGSRKVTCRRASSVFKKVFTFDILKTPTGTNCNEDFNSLITNQEDYRTLYSSSSQVLRPKRVPTIKVGTYDYQFNLPERNALIYVSYYLYRKCISQHSCEKIKSYIEETQNAANSSDSSRSHHKNFKRASMQSDFLVIPPETFVSFIKSLEKKFREEFDLAENITNVGNGILKLLEDSTFDMQCECFPIEYLKKLYARFRIYQTIKRNNELLKVELETQG